MFAMSKYLLWILLWLTSYTSAQELPPVVNYRPEAYGSGNQNWMVSQDGDKHLYFANNNGLLEYNGANWSLYPTPNQTIMRAVCAIGDRVYTGCFKEFGYWQRADNGRLRYVSLSRRIAQSLHVDEQFWNILPYKHWVVFQSLQRLYIYDIQTGDIRIVAPKGGIHKSFLVGHQLLYQVYGQGLFQLTNGHTQALDTSDFFKHNRLIQVLDWNNTWLLQTQHAGFFTYHNQQLQPFATEASEAVKRNRLYSSIPLHDGKWALGTVSDGVYILNADGHVVHHLTATNGLANNTALSLFEDVDHNLWVGLDNGIDCVNLQSPIRCYVNRDGTLGTVYTALRHQGYLYVGTNQGLFVKAYPSADDFTLVEGTKGQVWELFQYQGSVLCGHDSGTFVIQGRQAQPVYTQSGTWKFKPVPGHPNQLFQGHYGGLSILENTGGQWRLLRNIAGFAYSSKYFEPLDAHTLLVSHEYMGIFKLKVDGTSKRVIQTHLIDYPHKGKHASLTRFMGACLYACPEGVFRWDKAQNRFVKDKVLSQVFAQDEYTSGRMVVDATQKIWLFTKNYIHYFAYSTLSNRLEQNALPIPASLTKSMSGYENITPIDANTYCIGATDGYYTIKPDALSFANDKLTLTEVLANTREGQYMAMSVHHQPALSADQNNIRFRFAIPEYDKYILPEYRYWLEGFESGWRTWSNKSTLTFKNLPSGSYILHVQARIANAAAQNTIDYHFDILRPWYARWWAWCLYVLLGFAGIVYIHRAYKSHYRQQQQKLIEENNRLLEIKELETEQQLMKLQNERLAHDVDQMHKQLAASTMTLAQKNELLEIIKKDLDKRAEAEGNRSLQSMARTIDKNISEADSWKMFKDAFDTADKDFLKNLKQLHPGLTPNDLRLCAYLRLNMSSKEIAPLLNISVRSVEIKRYRLRKKMDLPHEQGLVEYILSL